MNQIRFGPMNDFRRPLTSAWLRAALCAAAVFMLALTVTLAMRSLFDEALQRGVDRHGATIILFGGVLLGLLGAAFVLMFLRNRAAVLEANGRLRASEAQFRDFADTAADWYWELGPDLTFTFLSGRYREVLGIDPSMVLGKFRSDLIDPLHPPAGWAEHLDALRQRKAFRDFRMAARLPNGTVRHVKISGKPLFGASGEFLGYRGTGNDVTKEVLAEQSAAQARRLLDSALETMTEGLVLFDPEDRLVLCNSRYRDIHGKIADLFVPGARFEDIIRAEVERGDIPEARQKPDEWIAKRLAGHRALESAYDRRRADGRWLHIHEWRMADGGYVGIHTDVTETKYREIELGELARRNALFAAAINTATSGIAITDAKLADHPILYINPMFTTITGYEQDDAIGLSYQLLYCTDAAPAAIETLHAAVRDGQSAEVRILSCHKDGRRIHLDLRVAPVTNRDGRVTHFVWIQNDVTAQVIAEEKLRESEELTRRQAAVLQDAVDALPEGFVLYDSDDRLILYNEKYRQLRGYDAAIAHGVKFEQILRSAIARGEISVPPENVESWIAERICQHRNPTEPQLMQLRGHWIRFSERPTRDGGIVSVLADITELKAAEARLRESEEHMRRQAALLEDAIDAMPEGFVLYDADDRVVMCNRRFRELRKVNPLSGVPGTSFGDILRNAVACGEVPAPKEGVEAWVQQRLQARQAMTGTNTLMMERRGRWIRLSEQRTRDGGIVAIHADITALKQAEARALESEHRAQRQATLLQDAIEAMPDGFALFDADDRFVMGNSKLREFRANNPAAVEPGTPFEAILRGAIASGELQLPAEAGGDLDAWIQRRVGHRRQLSADQPTIMIYGRDRGWSRISMRRTSDGGIVEIHADITAVKEAEARAKESEERIRTLASNLPGVLYQRVILPDGSARHSYLSDRAVDLFGYSADEIIVNPRWMNEIIHPDSVAQVRAILKQSQIDLKPVEFEYRFTRRDGQTRWARSMAAPRRTDRNDVIWDGVVFDITDQKLLQEQRQDLETQLRHAQKIEALGTLAGGIAHDINNTLVPVVALSKLTLRGLPPDSPHRDAMQTVVEASTHIRDLVKQILAFSRKDKTEARPVQLQSVISDVVRLLSASLKPNIRITQCADEAVPAVKCDETQVHQVLMNLCTNAAHAIGDRDGTIQIRLDPTEISEAAGTQDNLVSGGYARLRVADTGCGMDAVTLQRIFEPFFTTKKVGEGTGLGLSVVHGIVTNHGGRITADSEPGHGTTFTVLLPLYVESPDEELSAGDELQPALS